jgi:dephospho-CoA kinase
MRVYGHWCLKNWWAEMIEPLKTAHMPKLIGLTGGIATGKSTVAKLFMDLGIDVFDADAAVHRLYGPHGAAVARILRRFGKVGSSTKGIDRKLLAKKLEQEPESLKELEALVHPLVRGELQHFLNSQRDKAAPYCLLDSPLLFETSWHKPCEAVIVVYCSEQTQIARAMARPEMTKAKLQTILTRQMPTSQKLEKADFSINSDEPMAIMSQKVAQLHDILQTKYGVQA